MNPLIVSSLASSRWSPTHGLVPRRNHPSTVTESLMSLGTCRTVKRKSRRKGSQLSYLEVHQAGLVLKHQILGEPVAGGAPADVLAGELDPTAVAGRAGTVTFAAGHPCSAGAF